jgi:hypothetical protein
LGEDVFRSSSGPGRLRCSITLSGELPELVLGPVARQLTELGGRSRHRRDGPLPLVGHELRRRHGPPVQCPTPWSDLGGEQDAADVGSASVASISGFAGRDRQEGAGFA